MSKTLTTIVVALCVIAVTVFASPPALAQGGSAIVFSEIHYHPQEVGTAYPNFDDREDAEFVELTNVSGAAVDLTGWCIDLGVDYCFDPGTSLAPSESLVLARKIADFNAAYGFAPDGAYTGKLSNGGERVRLVDDTNTLVTQVLYATSDPWPVTPDGAGPSLELVSAAGANGDAANWSASATDDGTPGTAPILAAQSPPLVVSHNAPALVSAGSSIPISATATNTTTMSITYNVNYGSDQQVAMSLSGGLWTATLPSLSAGGFIQYRFDASGPGGVRTSPRADDSLEWFGVGVASAPISAVPVLDFFFSPDDWADIDDRNCGCVGSVAYNGEMWTGVTVRRAGFTSLNLAKGSLRLDFAPGHPFEAPFLDGPADELTIDTGHPNTEQIREKISADLLEAIGFPAIRSEHVRVSNNGSFHGLFLLREEQDGNWRARHNLDQGALYKVDARGPSFGFAGLFTKKEALNQPDTDVVALRGCLDEPLAARRTCLLDTVDIGYMINELAGLMAFRQADQREFNWFLYRDDLGSGLWRLLPDDFDRTWGIDGGGSELLNPNLDSGKTWRRCIGTDGPPANEVCRGIVEIPEFAEMFNRRVRTITDEHLADPAVRAEINALASLIEADWNADEAKWNRTSYSFSQITNALDNWVPNYVAHLQSGGHDGNVPAAQSAQPQVTMTELRTDTGDGLSYVLLTNPSATESVDVSNWTFAGLAEIMPGAVVLPGATIAVTNSDQLFRLAKPSFTGIRGELQGTLGGQVTLLRRDGSTAATGGSPPASSLVLNEWNAVSATNVLSGGDATFGTVAGNGGDWFELVVTEDYLDVRGWRLVLSDSDGGPPGIRDEFVFGNDPLLASLESGTIITVAESIADDISFEPPTGDWHLNFQANSADQGAYFTVASQENFDTNHANWQLSIYDNSGQLIFGPAGEGIGNLSGVNSSEIGELKTNPSTVVDNLSDYGDGDSSTFGLPNTLAGLPQDLSAVRFDYLWGDVSCDGNLNVADAQAILSLAVGTRFAAGRCPLGDSSTQANERSADTSGDGTVNVNDALLILQCAVGQINSFCPA